MNTPISDTFGDQLRQMRTELLAQVRAQRGGRVGRAEAAADARKNVGVACQDKVEHAQGGVNVPKM